ncbi:MAG: 16S rRNA (uracil1498-N3)-methyltransferase [Candidatus Azotimanducaceae bacterium]
MRISRFFIDQPLEPNGSIEIVAERAHYIRNVLRLKAGNPLILFNGTGGEYPATLTDVTKKSVCASLGAHSPVNRTPPRDVTLGLGILKREAMDFALQKAVELGVAFIQPLITDRITVPMKQVKSRRDHWQAIAISSCEQCGMNIIPQVMVPRELSDWCQHQQGNRLIADPAANPNEKPQRNLLAKDKASPEHISILVGPEGGFSESEMALANATGFNGINLGPRILRAETAAISLITLVNQALLESDSTNF